MKTFIVLLSTFLVESAGISKKQNEVWAPLPKNFDQTKPNSIKKSVKEFSNTQKKIIDYRLILFIFLAIVLVIHIIILNLRVNKILIPKFIGMVDFLMVQCGQIIWNIIII